LGVKFLVGLFVLGVGAALWVWLFTAKNSIKRKNKTNVLQVGWTKSVTKI